MKTILSHRLSDLPDYGKLFVGLFAALMLLVCLWAVIILYVEEGMIGADDELPAYLTNNETVIDTVAIAKQEKKEHPKRDFHEQLEHNVGLAHTHINGQTLLFFAIGLIFLFTSATPKTKKVTLSVLAAAVVLHTIGLTGHHFGWFYDDLLAVSGLTILLVIPYIAFVIFADLLKSSAGRSSVGK